MKAFPLALPFLCASLAVPSVFHAQEESNDGGQPAIADSRFRNVLRSVKKDPESALDAIPADAEESVRAATRMFSDSIDKVDTSGIDTPENRAKLERLGAAALAKANELAGEEMPEMPQPDAPAKPKPSPGTPPEKPEDTAKVPATRSAAEAVRFVTPIAMPIGEEPPAPLASEGSADTVVQESSVQPMADALPTEQILPDSPELTANDIPEPKPLTPKYNTRAAGGFQGAGKNHAQITARETIMDNNSGMLTFVGNVVLDHPEYELKCEKLEIELAQGAGGAANSNEQFKRAVASGGMVEIRRMTPDGKTQIALGRRADYNAVSGDMVLSGGPPYIQDGDRYVKTSSPDAKIVMKGTGQFYVTGSDAGPQNRTIISIPVESNGETQNIGIPGLGSGIEKLR